MNPLSRVRQFENLHIMLWLIKDSCWMLEWKLAATLAFFPTISMAIFICYKTRKTKISILANLAVLCWILANSCWMFNEFYDFPNRLPALMFFATGLCLILYYLYQIFVRNAEEEVI